MTIHHEAIERRRGITELHGQPVRSRSAQIGRPAASDRARGGIILMSELRHGAPL
jgi:hypothetical protein